MPSLKPPTLPSAQVFNGMLGVLGNKAGNEVANYQVFNEVSPKKVLYNRRLHKVYETHDAYQQQFMSC
jgi:hypothetical protein